MLKIWIESSSSFISLNITLQVLDYYWGEDYFVHCLHVSFVVFDQPFELTAPIPKSFLQRDKNVVYFCLYLLFIIGQVACRYIDKSLSAKSQQVISISRVRTYMRNYRRGLPFQEYMSDTMCLIEAIYCEAIYICRRFDLSISHFDMSFL